MEKSVVENIKKISQREINVLWSIYRYRCLTIAQIYDLHYRWSDRAKAEVPIDYCRIRTKLLQNLEIIKLEEYGELKVYFLTTLGVNIVKECFDLAVDVYYVDKNAVKRGYYRASELDMNPKLFQHQIATNQFMIDFSLRQYDIYWKFYDEKHISKFRSIRPDALLSTVDYDFFIETDMGTEPKKQLIKKWEHYRAFLESEEFHNYAGKVIVLFTINGVADIQRRINLVKKTIDEVLNDKFSPKFEIHINTMEELQDIIECEYLNSTMEKPTHSDALLTFVSQKHGFSLSKTYGISKFLNEENYLAYIRLLNDHGKIISINGKPQEFLIDSYLGEPISVMNKIANLRKSNNAFKQQTGRELSYIIVADLEDTNVLQAIFEDLKMRNITTVENVYFTSVERLKNKKFYNALIQFGFNGDIFEFTDWDLINRNRIGGLKKDLAN